MDTTTTTETPEQIAFYQAEIERMFAEMDASDKRMDEKQKVIDALATKTQATLDGIKERMK